MTATVVAGPDRGKSIALAPGEQLVGKSSSCALALSDPAVSRRHLKIELSPAGVRLVDLDSKNGSYYQGARFREVVVAPGARVTVGSSEIRIASAGAPEPLAPSRADHFGALCGRSAAMREVFAVLERVARAEAPVLIEGETGTGKELCAQAIHEASGRARGRFVICDLAGVARSLIESELFGHVKGAFTGAERDRDGCFVAAHRGTLFVDEIGELEPELQPRLLRALEQKRVKPVGAGDYRPVDVRVVAATNRDLRAEAAKGRFREDLYHRLAVLRVRLPPLRERKEDIPFLVEKLLAERADAGAVRVADETLALLAEYDWPGNVRELRNVIERGLSLLDQERLLTPAQLALETPRVGATSGGAPRAGEPFHVGKERLLAAWERDYLVDLLARTRGNVSQAARQSGLGRAHLYRLMKKHGLGE
jgi:DNA-binding NtrC family response regulator